MVSIHPPCRLTFLILLCRVTCDIYHERDAESSHGLHMCGMLEVSPLRPPVRAQKRIEDYSVPRRLDARVSICYVELGYV
jgi:hypothetical protein